MAEPYKDILASASTHISELSGHVFDLLTIEKPISVGAAVNLSKVVSKLSPLLGNLIEFNTVEFLNDQHEYQGLGTWHRQDPGFPDTIFISDKIEQTPGFEIKAWFPLATEITARFKDSQNHFKEDQTNICMLAWLPNQLIFGKPKIIDVCIITGRSVAEARDNHYHNPPDYLVLEPEDTTTRTRNLQQTNTNGYKWQGTAEQFAAAQNLVRGWGTDKKKYQPTKEYQALLRELITHFPYRLDTNYAKMDRIDHEGIEQFKKRVLEKTLHGQTIGSWARLLSTGTDAVISRALQTQFDIKDVDITEIIE